MGPQQERRLVGTFYRLGTDSVKNARARLTHYQPWANDALGNAPDMGTDMMIGTVVENAVPPESTQAAGELASKFGDKGVKALRAMGMSPRAISGFTRSVRALRAATRGMGAIGDIWEQLATLGAFSYSDSLLVSRYKNRLTQTSAREGYEEFAEYVDKVEPFFKTILEFITLSGMSIEAMPPNEVNVYAIEAAFHYNDIPITEDLHDYFYNPE